MSKPASTVKRTPKVKQPIEEPDELIEKKKPAKTVVDEPDTNEQSKDDVVEKKKPRKPKSATEESVKKKKFSKWTTEEENKIIEQHKSGMSFEDISKENGRTTNALLLHMRQLTEKKILEDEMSKEDALKFTGLSDDEYKNASSKIKDLVDKKKEYIQEKKKKTTDYNNEWQNEVINLLKQIVANTSNLK